MSPGAKVRHNLWQPGARPITGRMPVALVASCHADPLHAVYTIIHPLPLTTLRLNNACVRLSLNCGTWREDKPGRGVGATSREGDPPGRTPGPGAWQPSGAADSSGLTREMRTEFPDQAELTSGGDRVISSGHGVSVGAARCTDDFFFLLKKKY